MMDRATGWFEMEQIQNKTAAEAADICETVRQCGSQDLQSRNKSPATELLNSWQNSPRWSKTIAP
jgi:hypothetical protein